jgi:hypothetical protein
VIANLAHVRGYARDGGRGRLLVGDGATLPISRNRLPAVRDTLEGARPGGGGDGPGGGQTRRMSPG